MSITLAIGLALSPALSLQAITFYDGPDIGENGLAVDYGSGVCRVSVKGKDADGERIVAEFSRRLRDGNLGVALEGPFMQKFSDADPNANHPVTVHFDTGSSAPSRSGGYDVGGFRESAWGGWGPGEASDATYAAMKEASSFSVEMDGNTYGPFTWAGTGAVWAALDNCETENS
ncbi:MAG: hypothetical protein GW855_14360 [Erythrobacter sp.]|nr:hypothetical protein [Erythrobacter sp.]NCQ65075.1 hypothetical protein [Alphaproteobacteria bacterium]